LYEVCDADAPDLLEHKTRTLSEFEIGRIAYVRGDFAEAAQHFAVVAADDQRDGAAQYFHDRAATLLAAGNIANWDGVEHMESK
jgi:hypothetical protein